MSSSIDSDEEVPATPTKRPQSIFSRSSYDSDETPSLEDEVEYTNCRMEELPCFHKETSRSKAETLLKNFPQGSYMIRRSTETDYNYSVSVKTCTAVKHFRMNFDGERYNFGQASFWSPFEVWEHLKEKPILECDGGIQVHLLYPYIDQGKSEDVLYEETYRHYIPADDSESKVLKKQTFKKRNSNSELRSTKGSTIIMTTMEGQLFKKKEGKNWKRRWCMLRGNCFSYKTKQNKIKTLNDLNLREALEIKDDDSEPNMPNCFRIVFPNVYYIFSTKWVEDKNIWIENIQKQMRT